MSIAYLTSKYPAPSHTFIRREVDALRCKGLEIHTFSIRSPAPEEVAVLDDEVRAQTCYVLPASPWRLLSAHGSAFVRRPLRYLESVAMTLRHRVPGVRGWLWSLFYFVEAMLLVRELERRRIRHVHNHFANPAANVGLLATHYLGLTWSLTLHGISEFDYPAGVMLPDKLRAARFVACATYFGRAQAQRLVSASEWSKMLVVRCGVEVGQLPAQTRAREGTRLRLVCVARLSPEKGLAGLLEAFASVLSRGIDAELTLVGGGPDRAALERIIAHERLGARVALTGQVSESEALAQLASADVCVLASFMEGLPVVLMEALGLRIPVVAPCVAGIPELVRHGHEGLLFSPSNWVELADCLVQMLTDADLRERCANAGRLRIEREFDISKAVEPLARAFAERLDD